MFRQVPEKTSKCSVCAASQNMNTSASVILQIIHALTDRGRERKREREREREREYQAFKISMFKIFLHSWCTYKASSLLLNFKKLRKNKNSSIANMWRGIHCEEYRLCATASNNILASAIREEDMLCVTASLIVKKMCCVLLPASL